MATDATGIHLPSMAQVCLNRTSCPIIAGIRMRYQEILSSAKSHNPPIFLHLTRDGAIAALSPWDSPRRLGVSRDGVEKT